MAQGPDEGFRVTDRRHRDPVEASPPSSPPPSRPEASRQSVPPQDAAQRSLIGLFVMLASEVLMALGETANPVTGERLRELPHAAALIDLLTLLREKTEGHRSAEETKTLEELIYDVQLRYVAAVKSSRR